MEGVEVGSGGGVTTGDSACITGVLRGLSKLSVVTVGVALVTVEVGLAQFVRTIESKDSARIKFFIEEPLIVRAAS